MRHTVVIVIALTLTGCTADQGKPGSLMPSPAVSDSDQTLFNTRTVNAAFGQFGGQPLHLIPAGCTERRGKACRLASSFWFADRNGLRWHPKNGMLTDGASIPKFAQPLIGKPYDPRYVASAVVHDHYYNRRVRTYAKTQRQYYDASRALGTDAATAAAMYYAILVAGTAWVELEKPENCPQPDATCVRNNPLPAGIRMETADDGKLYAEQNYPINAEMRDNFRRFANEAKRKGSALTAEAIEQRAISDYPDNVVMQLGDRQKMTVSGLTVAVTRSRAATR